MRERRDRECDVVVGLRALLTVAVMRRAIREISYLKEASVRRCAWCCRLTLSLFLVYVYS